MAKYSEEFKIKLVTEYLHENLGYKLLTKNTICRRKHHYKIGESL